MATNLHNEQSKPHIPVLRCRRLGPAPTASQVVKKPPVSAGGVSGVGLIPGWGGSPEQETATTPVFFLNPMGIGAYNEKRPPPALY